jgi:hypothetical protein
MSILSTPYTNGWSVNAFNSKARIAKAGNAKKLLTRAQILECNRLLTQPLGAGNYWPRLSLLLHCEENQLEFDIHHYDMQGVTMTKEK